MGHLDLARWADALVVAPATADAIARLAQGRSDDLLGAVALSFRGPLLVAPAMETNMFLHPATQEHLHTLARRGATVVGPASGRLASGSSGPGRMSEPEEIAAAIGRALGRPRSLDGLRVLVTAGPTFEPIDPVRYIGNRSSGKMGYAVAEEAAARGAAVTLISGPTALEGPAGVNCRSVETSAEMLEAVSEYVQGQDVVVMAAAVSDFRPGSASADKLRRSQSLSLELVPTRDIAVEARRLAPNALHIGFALETGNLVESAREKLRSKGQALVVANAVTPDYSPFGSETNRVLFVTEDQVREVPEAGKREIAGLLWDEIERLLAGSERSTAAT
jgi:phosphopantothenoylcysteine decarboxylase/phosphopantothenate--cysteine ligase